MTLEYNIYLEFAMIPLDIILCVFLLIRYTKRTKVNIAFKRFAFTVTIANIMDVLTAIVTSAHEDVPNAIHYFFNTTDSMLAALSGFLFIYYVYAYVKMDESHYRIRKMVNNLLLILDFLLLFTNPFTHWVFEYDANGNYIHNFLFTPVAYGFPILFFLIDSIYMLIHWKDYKKTQIYTLIVTVIVVGIVMCIQMFFFDTFLVTFFVASLGVLVVYLSLETPEYEKLIETMSQLHEAEAREAVNEAKARLSQQVMTALA